MTVPAGPSLPATVGIAQDLGIICVAEGIETTAQRDALPPYDGLRVQGFLYGRPQRRRPARRAMPEISRQQRQHREGRQSSPGELGGHAGPL